MIRKRIMTWITLIVWATLMIIPTALCEQSVWECPECGRTGNTGNYCGGCAHPAPWNQEKQNSSDNVPSSGFAGTTMEEIVSQADELLLLAKSWTNNTVPKTLDSFPVFPQYLLELEDYLNQTSPVLVNEGGIYKLKLAYNAETILDFLPDAIRNAVKYDRIDINWIHTTGPSLKDESSDTFVLEMPEGKRITDIEEFIAYYHNGYDPDKLSLDLNVVYPVKNGKLTGESHISLSIFKNDGYIHFLPGFSNWGYDNTDALCIDISGKGTSDPERWDVRLVYDMKTGKLRLFSQ